MEITIGPKEARDLEACLRTNSLCEYPPTTEDRENSILIDHFISWSTAAHLRLTSALNIIFGTNGGFNSTNQGSLTLRAGFENRYNRDPNHTAEGSILFREGAKKKVILMQGGRLELQHNPVAKPDLHKYSRNGGYEFKLRSSLSRETVWQVYMMVNHVGDLHDMRRSLYFSYALSQNIDARETVNWGNGSGFKPIYGMLSEEPVSFSGDFTGNGFSICNLYINAINVDMVGLFGITAHSIASPNRIENVVLENATIFGNHYVGGVAGVAKFTHFHNVSVIDSQIVAKAVAGGLLGTGNDIYAFNISVVGTVVKAQEYTNQVFGTLHCVTFEKPDHGCSILQFKDIPEYVAPSSVKKHLSKILTIHPNQTHDDVRLRLNGAETTPAQLQKYATPTPDLLKPAYLGALSGVIDSVDRYVGPQNIPYLIVSRASLFGTMYALDYSLAPMFVYAALSQILERGGFSRQQIQWTTCSFLLMLNVMDLDEERMWTIGNALLGMASQAAAYLAASTISDALIQYIAPPAPTS